MAVPSWKQAILDKRRKQEEEEARRKKDEQAKLSAIPAWKRSLMQRKDESKAPAPKSFVTKALLGSRPSTVKSQEKTPSNTKAKPTTDKTIAKSTEDKETSKTVSQSKTSGWGKVANGSTVVEKNVKPHAATPPVEKVALRRTASSDAATSNSPSPNKSRRWPVVQPPTTLLRSSSSPRNTKREVGVPEAAAPSEDSPTLPQRKEALQIQVVKASPPVAKQRKMNSTSPLLQEKPFPAAEETTHKEEVTDVRCGSVRSLMGLFQGAAKTGNKTTVNSTSSGARKMVNQRVEHEHPSEENKLTCKTLTNVSQVFDNPAGASSPIQKAKTALAVSVESKLPAGTEAASFSSPVISNTEHSAASNGNNKLMTSKKCAPLPDQKTTAEEDVPLEKLSLSPVMNHTEMATESEAINPVTHRLTTNATVAQHHIENDQVEKPFIHDVSLSGVPSPDQSSNDPKTQWEEEGEEDELTVTSIDDVINTSDEEERHQQTKEIEAENVTPLVSTSTNTAPAQSTTASPSTLSKDTSVHERRTSATLTPHTQADVSGVIGDAQAESILNSAASSAQNSDSECTPYEPKRRKSSLVDRSKPRKHSRRVSFNEVQLEVEHVYPKPIYEDDETISSPVQRRMVTDIDETDSTVVAVEEQRHREKETGLALPPHPILQPQVSSPTKGSPSNFPFGASLHTYQPESSSYSHLQGTLEKRKKKSKDKKSKKEEAKPVVVESPIDYSKLNEETAAMLW